MGTISPRLQLKVAQKQILTPGLVQMVTVLQLNRLELKEMISQEMSQTPVLEEAVEDGTEELAAEEIQAILEAERDPAEPAPADQGILEVVNGAAELSEGVPEPEVEATDMAAVTPSPDSEAVVEPKATDPFEEIDFGTFFDDYLDPGYRSPVTEAIEKPSFETFLSAPVTLADYLHSQLSVLVLSDPVRDAAELIIGNLDENGYLSASLEEIAIPGEHTEEELGQALRVVQSLDPAGIGARDVRECLLLQLESNNGRGGVAWEIVSEHLKLLESHQHKELAKLLGRPLEHVQIAAEVIRRQGCVTLQPEPVRSNRMFISSKKATNTSSS
jgi:RNA polymerase sigma-54 factor